MNLRASLLTSAAALAMATVPAEARGLWYFNVSGGANWVNDDGFFVATAPTASADTLNFRPDSDIGWVISAAVGARLDQVMPGLRVEVEGSYRDNSVNGLWTTNTGTPTNVSSGTLDIDETTWAVLANVWWDFDIGNFRPYVGGGIGWAHSELDGTYQGGGGGTPNFVFEGDGFAWQLGGGIKFAFSPNVEFGVGYRYFRAPDIDVAAYRRPPTNAAVGNVDVENHSVLLEMSFAM